MTCLTFSPLLFSLVFLFLSQEAQKHNQEADARPPLLSRMCFTLFPKSNHSVFAQSTLKRLNQNPDRLWSGLFSITLIIIIPTGASFGISSFGAFCSTVAEEEVEEEEVVEEEEEWFHSLDSSRFIGYVPGRVYTYTVTESGGRHLVAKLNKGHRIIKYTLRTKFVNFEARWSIRQHNCTSEILSMLISLWRNNKVKVSGNRGSH